MSTLEQVRARLDDVLRRMETLNDLVVGENGDIRAFTEDEKAKYDGAETEAKQLRETISRLEGLRDARAEVSALDEIDKPSPRIAVSREENRDEKGEFRGFRSFGEQLQAIYRAGQPGNNFDPRLKQLRAASGANETVGAEGGFLVQTDFLTEMLKDVYDTGKVARLCRRLPLSANSNSVEIVTVDESSRADGSRWGGVQAYWRAEAGTVTATQPKWKNVRITAESLMALCYATDELLQDAPALGSYISQAFTEELAFKLDDAIINGDGAGKPLGVLNAPCLVTVAKESGQTADTVVFANVSKMRNLNMWARGLSRFVWLVNQEVLGELEKLYVPLGTATGLPVYAPAGQYGLENATLYGRPIVVSEHCAKLGDEGDIIAFDPEMYLLVEKGGVDAQTSVHVKFINAEQTFRFIMRVNGMPLLSSAITPFKATSGVKHSIAVSLAARA